MNVCRRSTFTGRRDGSRSTSRRPVRALYRLDRAATSHGESRSPTLPGLGPLASSNGRFRLSDDIDTEGSITDLKYISPGQNPYILVKQVGVYLSELKMLIYGPNIGKKCAVKMTHVR